MSDKELLELAAKAVGFSDYYVSEWDGGASLMHSPDPKNGPVEWNPLTDDGDALRLAVKLRIDIGFHGRDSMYAQSPAYLGECQGAGGEFDCGLDDYALTRRSIVEAAAEIGSMKP